jgi:hypothetical protein
MTLDGPRITPGVSGETFFGWVGSPTPFVSYVSETEEDEKVSGVIDWSLVPYPVPSFATHRTDQIERCVSPTNPFHSHDADGRRGLPAPVLPRVGGCQRTPVGPVCEGVERVEILCTTCWSGAVCIHQM